MQKQKFYVTCPITIFVESVPVPPEHEKLCVDISCLGHTGVHYVTRRSHRMQKKQVQHNVSRSAFCVSTFHAPDAPEHDVQIPPDAKIKVQRHVPQYNFCGIRTSPTRA
jgi:hypothetical protein